MVIRKVIKVNKMEKQKKYLECNNCNKLNGLGATTCKHCGKSLENAKTVNIRMVKKEMSLGWKGIGSILLIIASLIVLADPFDLFPMPFFDAFAFVIVAIVIWIVVLVATYKQKEWTEVKEYEK